MSAPRPAPELASDAHKGDAGRLLALCGSRWMPGAAILVCRAAQRGGAGLVRLAALDPELAGVVPVAAPEAIYAAPGDEAPERFLAAADDHALVAGPGLGATARTRAWVEAILAGWTRPWALDADALNVLAGEPERLAGARAPLVITPHPGEAARLLGRAVPADEAGRREAALELATRGRCVVCLKGAGTVVTDGERTGVNPTGNPGMATAGSGDVLTGLLGAYLTAVGRAGWTALDAALAAVFVHGLAGDLAAAELGERAVVASDLIDFLPAAQRQAREDSSIRGDGG